MVIAGSYTWSQTNDSVDLVIPLRGSSAKSKTVLETLYYNEFQFKVSYSPFLVDLDLFEAINHHKSNIVLKDNILYVKLVKKVSGVVWDDLLYTRDDREKRRERAKESRRRELIEYHEKAREKKVEEERSVVRKQMEIERMERQAIDDRKAEEKKVAERNVFDVLPTIKQSKVVDAIEHCNSEDSQVALYVGSSSYLCTNSILGSNTHDMPSPRRAILSRFKFTPRLFKTPMRESTIEQEQDFIVKNRPFLRKNNMLNRDALDITESDPVWLKKKADTFFRNGDYFSAINAYSDVFDIDPAAFKEAIGNRALCYFHIREFHLCISDCSLVLNNIPKTQLSVSEYTEKYISKIHIRRGMAYFCEQKSREGLLDFERALALNPMDSNLAPDCARAKHVHDVMTLKQKADLLCLSGSLSEALNLYNECCLLEPSYVSAYSNKTMCLLAEKQYSECIDVCTKVITLLSTGPGDKTHRSSISNFTFGLVPPSLSEKRYGIVACTLLRRGIALAKLCEKNDTAKCDLNLALELLDGYTYCSDEELIELEKNLHQYMG